MGCWFKLYVCIDINLTPGDFNTDPFGNCNGICSWRRAFWANLQEWAIQRGWGSYTIIFGSFFCVSFLRQCNGCICFLWFLDSGFWFRHGSSFNNLYLASAIVMPWYLFLFFFSFSLFIISRGDRNWNFKLFVWLFNNVLLDEASMSPWLEVGEHIVGW